MIEYIDDLIFVSAGAPCVEVVIFYLGSEVIIVLENILRIDSVAAVL